MKNTSKGGDILKLINDDIFEIIKHILLDKDTLTEIYQKANFNKEYLSKYYNEYFEEWQLNAHKNKTIRVDCCSRLWWFDVYQQQGIKDQKSINFCGDKFCPNCQKFKQATRLIKFAPLINEAAEKYSIYHFVLTVPNVKAEFLSVTIQIMFQSFTKLVNYLKCKSGQKLKGFNFEDYKYQGCFRSLEVTYNNLKKEYHPHLHCILAVDKDVKFEKNIINKFSYDYRSGEKILIRQFSGFEVAVQNIWYLLNNNKRVTVDNLAEVEDGYSCILDEIDEGSCFEVFKYATKVCDENSEILTYDNFVILLKALLARRTIQGYGCFYNIQAGEDEEIDESIDEVYNRVIESLQAVEEPNRMVKHNIEELVDDCYNPDKRFIHISRKNIFKYLKLLEENKKE